MKRFAATCLVLALVGSAFASSVQAQSFYLTTQRARGFMRTALSRRYVTYRNRAGAKVVCNQRVSRGRVRCEMGWAIGDTDFFGNGVIWVTYPHGLPYWNYAWRVHELNEYCFAVEHHSLASCSRVLIVR